MALGISVLWAVIFYYYYLKRKKKTQQKAGDVFRHSNGVGAVGPPGRGSRGTLLPPPSQPCSPAPARGSRPPFPAGLAPQPSPFAAGKGLTQGQAAAGSSSPSAAPGWRRSPEPPWQPPGLACREGGQLSVRPGGVFLPDTRVPSLQAPWHEAWRAVCGGDGALSACPKPGQEQSPATAPGTGAGR